MTSFGAVPVAQSGELDGNGDVVDALRERLERAVGPFFAADVDRDEHIGLVETLLARVRGARA